MSFRDADSSTVKVWDPLVLVFQWSLVFSFLFALITEDDWLNLHVQAGYAASFLIGFRLLLGLEDARNARFMSFVKSPTVMLTYFKGMLSFKVPLAGTVFSTMRGDWMVDVNPEKGEKKQS
jgi:cytochrome b